MNWKLARYFTGRLALLALVYAGLGAFTYAMGGCRHSINTANPRVVMAATLLDASNTTVAVEDGLTAANHVVDSLEQSEPDYYAKVKPLIRKISAANKAASDKIVAAKNGDTTADWRGAVNAVAASVKPGDLTAFGFKNQNTQALVTAAFATLVATLNAIPGTFGAGTGGTR